jgi:hypothetical protein
LSECQKKERESERQKEERQKERKKERKEGRKRKQALIATQLFKNKMVLFKSSLFNRSLENLLWNYSGEK